MNWKLTTASLIAGIVLATLGCVERKMLIRSDPPGAPVWIDERYAGETPLDRSFNFYGERRIRVGPIRDKNDKITYREVERVVKVEAPGYETFPIDFFYEVLNPVTMKDVHEFPLFRLPKASEVPQQPSAAQVEDIRREATEFRDKALRTIPEEAPAP
jgi:hypothetical protein